MDESTQQLIALFLVAAAVAFELWRRWRRRRKRTAGCDGCDTPGNADKSPGDQPVRFYRRR